MNIKDRFTFENYGSNSFMVYELNAEEKIDSIGVGMLSNNKISGVLPFNFSQMDDKRYFKFNITSRLSLTQFFTGAVNKKRLVAVFSSITNAMAAAEEYMLQPEYFILDSNFIFVDASTGTAALSYMPIENIKPEDRDFKEFVKSIMYSVQFDQNENGDYVLKILSFLNGNTGFSIPEFKRLIDELSGSGQNKASSQQATQQPAQQQPIQQTVPPKPIQQQVSQQGNTQQTPPGFQAVNKSTNVNKPMGPKAVVPNSQPPQQAKPQAPAAVPNMGFEIPGMPGGVQAKPQEMPKKEKKPGLFGSIFSSNKKKKNEVSEPKKAANNRNMANAPVNPPQGQPTMPPVYGNPVMQTPNIISAPVIVNSTTHPVGETTLLGVNGGGETTVLSNESSAATPYLLRVSSGEKVYLNKGVFRIGKEKSFVDYVCSGNNAISRAHADFITRNGEYFIRDNNSTNGTYINGTRLTSNQDIKIKHDDKIVLANEAFEFKLY